MIMKTFITVMSSKFNVTIFFKAILFLMGFAVEKKPTWLLFKYYLSIINMANGYF